MAQGEAAFTSPSAAGEKLLEAAYELFTRRGVRAVGIDAIIERAGVARQSLYRTYGSKEELVLAALRQREDLWTFGWLRTEVEARTQDPAERLLAIFDVFDEWFRAPGYEGCFFINVMLEHPDPDDAVRAASTGHLAEIRRFLSENARGAGVAEPDDVARQWHILMKGSIVAACEGDHDAARRAQDMGRLLLAAVVPPRRSE